MDAPSVYEELPPITIMPYSPELWTPLCYLVAARLAEHGIALTPQEIEVPADEEQQGHEWDLHQMRRVYQRGSGSFWLAMQNEIAAGSVGAQDLGGLIELRRMYVRTGFRNRGIGRRLVQALIDYCLSRSVLTIELWTAFDGPGRSLYASLGFQIVPQPGIGFDDLQKEIRRVPKAGEIRMRLSLTDTDGKHFP